MHTTSLRSFVAQLHATRWVGAGLLGIFIGAGLQAVYAWTGPTQAPPSGNVPGPITATMDSAAYQTRAAGLGLAGSVNVTNAEGQNNKVTTPKLCLNNDGGESNCIRSWSDIQNYLSTGGTGGGGTTSYTIQCTNSGVTRTLTDSAVSTRWYDTGGAVAVWIAYFNSSNGTASQGRKCHNIYAIQNEWGTWTGSCTDPSYNSSYADSPTCRSVLGDSYACESATGMICSATQN